MGMFDYIKCDYPLPLTDEIREALPDEDWSEITFQTKSLDCYLETYTIEEDGQIYAERKDRYIDEKGAFQEKEIGIEKVEDNRDVEIFTDEKDKRYYYPKRELKKVIKNFKRKRMERSW
jgi:hypothetical protein